MEINLLDIPTALIIIGLLCIFAGTIAISGQLFRNLIAGYYLSNSGRQYNQIPLKYRFFGRLFGIDRFTWTNVFLVSSQQSKKDIKKFKDPDAPIRAATWIFVGTSLQILSFFI